MRDFRLWVSRLLIGLVVGWNLECALVFLYQPQAYTASFGLAGTTGEVALRAMGILFLMWNIPYLAALLQPRKHRFSLYEAMIMQAIGLAGESALYLALPVNNEIVRMSIFRFVLFDGAGLIFLLLALWMVNHDLIFSGRMK